MRNARQGLPRERRGRDRWTRKTVRLYDPAVHQLSGQGTIPHPAFAGSHVAVMARIGVANGKVLKGRLWRQPGSQCLVLISDHYEGGHLLSSHLKTILAMTNEGGTPFWMLMFQIG